MNAPQRTALVTGGNRGLGLETCKQLAAHGLRVLLTARSVNEATAAAASLASEGRAVTGLALDVTQRESIHALARTLQEDGTQLDVLVNNAGIYEDGAPVLNATRTLDVNFFGPLHVTQALLPHLAPHSTVVMVSSGLGELAGLTSALRARLSDPALSLAQLEALVQHFLDARAEGTIDREGWPTSDYRVSKLALNALTQVFARMLQLEHIRVNAVCPGWARTQMGGANAPRSVEQGGASIVSACSITDASCTGQFFRDGRAIPW